MGFVIAEAELERGTDGGEECGISVLDVEAGLALESAQEFGRELLFQLGVALEGE